MKVKSLLIAVAALLVSVSLPNVVSAADSTKPTEPSIGIEHQAVFNLLRMGSDMGATGV